VFGRLCGIDPEAPENWCSLGEARLAAGDPDQAEIAYGHAARIDPSAEADFFSRLALGLDRTGHRQRALAAWERSLAAHPDAPPVWMELGDCQLRLGKPDDAIRSYGRAADLQPAAAGGCWHRLGNHLAREGLPLRAAEAFTRAIAAEPGNPLYHLRLAAAFVAGRENDLAEAALLLAKALTSSPADPPG
jgi:cytochrome c-type biogenesis protein CcmH/NrfG